MFKDALALLGMGLGIYGPSAEVPALDAQEMLVGTGPEIALGQRVTVHFLVAAEDGHELANSRKRGLPYTFAHREESTDLFSRLVVGMKVGGQRKVRLAPEEAFGSQGFPPIIPGNQPVIVVVTVLKSVDR